MRVGALGVPAFIRNHIIPPSKNKGFSLAVADEHRSHPRTGGSRGCGGRGNETDFPGGSPGPSGEGAESGEPGAGGTESGRGGGGGRPGAARHLPGSRGRWDGGQVVVTGGGVRAARPGKAAAGSPRVSAVGAARRAGGAAAEAASEGTPLRVGKGRRNCPKSPGVFASPGGADRAGGCFRVTLGRPRSEERCSRARFGVEKMPCPERSPTARPRAPLGAQQLPPAGTLWGEGHGLHPALRHLPTRTIVIIITTNPNHQLKTTTASSAAPWGALWSLSRYGGAARSSAVPDPRVGGSREGCGGLRTAAGGGRGDAEDFVKTKS